MTNDKLALVWAALQNSVLSSTASEKLLAATVTVLVQDSAEAVRFVTFTFPQDEVKK